MKPSLRRLGALACCVLWGALAAGCRGPSPLRFDGAPIVLISVDTLRADHLPGWGYAAVRTPHLDALFQDSILFENAYSHTPLTLPSHLTMLTGLLPADHSVRDNIGYPFDGEAHPTLARILKGHGYTSGGAVSAYVLRGATGIRDSMDFFDDSVGVQGAEQDLGLVQRPGGETTQRALAWIEGVKDAPFFLFLHLYEPHAPYTPPEPFRTTYGATYDGEIAASDAIVGAFLDRLKEIGVYDRAIVAFVSDHGEGLGQHGEKEHGILLYREVLHVPFALKLPRSREARTRRADPVGLIDLVPTLLALVHADAPKGLRGVNLLGPSEAGARAARSLYSETYYPRIHFGWSELRSLVDARYHLIQGPTPELYRLKEDEGEQADLAPREAEVARRMGAAIERFDARFGGPGPVDPETAEKIKALGYVAAEAAPPEGGARPNPKDRIAAYEGLKATFDLVRQGKNEEAVTALRRSLKDDPGSFDTARELGGALARLGRFDEAAEAYQHAMTLSPSLAPSVSLSVGQVQLDQGKLDLAERSARVALKSQPESAHELLASVALARGDLRNAEAEANEALALEREPRALLTLARICGKEQQFLRALVLLDEVPKDSQDRVPGFQFLRGDTLAHLERYPEAEAAFRREIQLFPGDSQAYANLAVLLGLAGRPKEEVRALVDSMVSAKPTRDVRLLAVKTLDFVGDHEGAASQRSHVPPEGRR